METLLFDVDTMTFAYEDTVFSHDSSIKDAWFEFEGDLVTWIRYRVVGNEVSLWSVETRPGFLNNGFASKAFQLLMNYYKTSEILHEGSYTPEGENFIAKYLKHVGDSRNYESYPSMTFVKSWEKDSRSA